MSPTTLEEELRPCPFCAVGHVSVEGRGVYCVGCLGCGARTTFFQRKHEAIAAWNARRPAPLGEEGAVEHIRAALDFAYKHGLHEFGYDPLASLLDEVAALRGERDEALRPLIGGTLPNPVCVTSSTGIYLVGDKASIEAANQWRHDAEARLPAVIERLKDAEARAQSAESRIAELEGDLERRAASCRGLAAKSSDPGGAERCSGKADAYAHAAELAREALSRIKSEGFSSLHSGPSAPPSRTRECDGEGEPDYYPSHEALNDLVSLQSEHWALNGGGPGWKDRWEAALRRAEEIVRVEP